MPQCLIHAGFRGEFCPVHVRDRGWCFAPSCRIATPRQTNVHHRLGNGSGQYSFIAPVRSTWLPFLTPNQTEHCVTRTPPRSELSDHSRPER